MKKQIIYQVDSFTNQAFKGNPAGVCILEDEKSEEWMQNIAAEMNLSETAFLIPKDEVYKIRFFTPTVEVKLCGHATLASAHILYQEGLIKEGRPVKFISASGELTVSKIEEWITMDFPVYSLEKIEEPENFSLINSIKALEFFKSDKSIIAVLESEDQVNNAKPDFEAMIKNNMGHLILTAKSDKNEIDFVLRYFAPGSGINEDPVTGSAQCSLVPLWNMKMSKNNFKSLQTSRRKGYIKSELRNDRVLISGQAVTIFKAELGENV